MSEVTSFFELFQRETLLSVTTAALGKVIKIDSSKDRVDIQPLFLTADKDENVYKQSIINSCLVPKHCKEDVQLNMLVSYIPYQRNIDNLDGTKFIDPDSFDLLSSNNAVIIGVHEK